MVQNKRIWDLLKIDDVDNEQLNIVEIIDDRHQIGETVEDDTLCRPNVDPRIVERLIRSNVADDFINDENDRLSHQSESSDDE